MPSKLQTTVEMVAYTAKDICSHPEVFTAFLETAANNYKYGFRDQLLIFAQKRMPPPVPKLKCGISSVGMLIAVQRVLRFW